jgi:hypothetical protein
MKLPIKVETHLRVRMQDIFNGKFRKGIPQRTHADRFDENRVYSITSYSGELFPDTIDVFDRERKSDETLKKYYSDSNIYAQMISKICRKNFWSKLGLVFDGLDTNHKPCNQL